MASGKGTFHHRLHGWTGAIMILSLVPFLYGFVCAIAGKSEGFTNWLSEPLGAISTLIFTSAAFLYCKLEFDEVILDYADGGLRSFGLFANRLVAFVAWAIVVFVICKIWLA